MCGVVCAMGVMGVAQGTRLMSGSGTASAQVQGKWVQGARQTYAFGRGTYEGGKWIDVTYGSPLKRGRDPWGSGADYGKALLIGAPIWRAGAEVSTRLKTEVPLVIGGKTVPPGEYTMFIDLKEHNWTLVISRWTAQPKYDPNDKTALWGAYNYTPDKDVLRTPMKLEALPHAFEALSWQFLDMTSAGGTLAIVWDKVMASVGFTAG
jgi:hypothetical protein